MRRALERDEEVFMPLFCLSLFISISAFGFDNLPGQDSGGSVLSLKDADVFNGIDGKSYEDFWKKWQLVTVRNRKDNGELRFIYANPIAWKAIQQKKDKYPEGSVFAKVAFTTMPDSVFPVSDMPARVSRFQIMKKDSKKYASTDGWGYAIYPKAARGGHEGAPGENAVVTACHACHKAVPSRDYVFSLSIFSPPGKSPFLEGDLFYKQFKEVDFSTLDDFQKKTLQLITTSPTKVRVLKMPLFSGSLQESIGPLAGYSARDKVPYFLIDEKKSHYLITVPAQAKKECKDPISVLMLISPSSAETGVQSTQPIRSLVCDGVNRWEPPR